MGKRLKVIERYIFKEALGYFLISLLAFTSVLLSVRILRFANLIINKGVDFSQIATVFIAIIPTFLEFAVPMACLLGVTLAIARLSGDSEIIVLRSSGISITQLIRPVLIFGVIVSLFGLVISVYLRPWGYQKLDETLFEIAQTKTTAGLEAGVFNQLGKIIIYAEKINSIDGDLERIVLDDLRSEDARKIIIADTGLISSNPKDREILIVLRNGTIHEKTGQKYSVTEFDRNHIKLNALELMGTEDKNTNQKTRQVSTAELISLLNPNTPIAVPETVEDEQFSTADYFFEVRMELARRFAIPFASLLLGLLGLALGVQPPRLQKTWGSAFSLALGLVIFAFYFGLMSVSSILTEQGLMPVWLSAWFPNIVTLLLAVIFLRKVGSEKWQSVADGLSSMKFFRKQRLSQC